jgi:hypothetical protein
MKRARIIPRLYRHFTQISTCNFQGFLRILLVRNADFKPPQRCVNHFYYSLEFTPTLPVRYVSRLWHQTSICFTYLPQVLVQHMHCLFHPPRFEQHINVSWTVVYKFLEFVLCIFRVPLLSWVLCMCKCWPQHIGHKYGQLVSFLLWQPS